MKAGRCCRLLDVAPGASLLFATADGGQANFANNIQALAAAGAKVIVDDRIYFTEPMFQDGIIAQAVDSVVADGTAYFSAAGNLAQQSYQSAFRSGGFFAPGAFPSAPGAPAFLGGTAHDFNSSGGTDQFQSIRIPGFTAVILILQWDSPFFSVSGPPGSQTDLDLYILNSSATQVLLGTTSNNTGSDAVELLSVINNGTAAATVNLMIVNHSGPNPGLIKYVYFFSGAAPRINEFATNSSTIFGHANAVGAEAVGAAAHFSTPAFGVSPPLLERFSSSGTTPVLFDVAGNRLPTPDPRGDKPEVVAPDSVRTTVSGFFNFLGTSAAAPHAAGAAALLLDLNPSLTPAQIYKALENTAINMGPPGFDNSSGFGLVRRTRRWPLLRIRPPWILTETGRVTLPCTETGFGGSSGPPMEVGFHKNGAERPKISLCRQTMTGMARLTLACTETGFGGSSGPPMEVGFHKNGAEQPKISLCRQTMMGMARLTLPCTETGFGGSSGLLMEVGFHKDGAERPKISLCRQTMMGMARLTLPCTETGFGGSSGLPMEVGFHKNGAERPKISLCRQTMMGMARLTLPCTETGFGGSSGLPMEVGFHKDGAEQPKISLCRQTMMGMVRLTLPCTETGFGGSSGLPMEVGFHNNGGWPRTYRSTDRLISG